MRAVNGVSASLIRHITINAGDLQRYIPQENLTANAVTTFNGGG